MLGPTKVEVRLERIPCSGIVWGRDTVLNKNRGNNLAVGLKYGFFTILRFKN
jgi:hypothetical protein